MLFSTCRIDVTSTSWGTQNSINSIADITSDAFLLKHYGGLVLQLLCVKKFGCEKRRVSETNEGTRLDAKITRDVRNHGKQNRRHAANHFNLSPFIFECSYHKKSVTTLRNLLVATRSIVKSCQQDDQRSIATQN